MHNFAMEKTPDICFSQKENAEIEKSETVKETFSWCTVLNNQR